MLLRITSLILIFALLFVVVSSAVIPSKLHAAPRKSKLNDENIVELSKPLTVVPVL